MKRLRVHACVVVEVTYVLDEDEVSALYKVVHCEWKGYEVFRQLWFPENLAHLLNI